MQTEKIIDRIVIWLTDYAKQARVKGFVVGVSGGVDSGVVSTLCAMTDLEVLVLQMPIRQKADQVDRASEHIEYLKSKFSNVKGLSIDLTTAFDELTNIFDANQVNIPNRDLALANTRSRLRMLSLYYYGQINSMLVCGTGNKVEDFGIGFYTKYGDGGVDLSPIADLYKTEVYKLARALDLPESIKNAIPTDGLWDAERTDEQQIGATYPELEKIQKEYGTKSESDYSGRDLEVFKIFDRMHKAAQHKIQPIPVCAIPDGWK
jgi:NAD+ synthase